MDALAELSAWLKRTGLGWYLFGGQAALLRGSTRVTADIDVTVVGSLEVLDRLLGSLPEAFARRADRAFTERTFVLPLLHQPSGVPVDLVIGWTQFEAEVLERCEVIRLGRRRIPVISTEDLLALKVLSGRDRDLLDAQAIIAANPHFDRVAARSRVVALAAALDDPAVTDRLDKIAPKVARGAPKRRPQKPR